MDFTCPNGATPSEHGWPCSATKLTHNYLAASRDLIGFGQPAEQGQPLENLPSDEEKQATNGQSRQETPELRGMSFARLPETRKEVEAIAALFTPNAKVYVGEQAREETLINVNAPRVLHLATHGFFLEDRPLPEIEFGPVQFDTTMQFDMIGKRTCGMPSPGFQFQDPLQRSGIALSGANHTDQNGNATGLVTADKILDLRLRGTGMVVLSACETGLGDVQTGEGVYGLRRAFLQVGAKSLVMSLWNVPDRETRELMVRFYENLNTGKLNRAQALREAMLHQKKITEERYGSPYPFYWGAFVFLGEP